MKKIGLLIHPEELDEFWVDDILRHRVDILGLHPTGGTGENTRRSLEKLLSLRETPEFHKLIRRLEDGGVEVEYAFHGMSFLMPHELFAEHPDWFRMDTNGKRVNDLNFCPSNSEALKYLEAAAEKLARRLPVKNHRYHIWQDDAEKGSCSCPLCRKLTRSQQALIISNTILRGLRRFDPLAKQSYLAYRDTLELSGEFQPDEGLYLEFAPIQREFTASISDATSEVNRHCIASLDELLARFGHRDSTVLEYWIDNSLFSNWTKPPNPLSFSEEVTGADGKFYAKKGFEYITSFACFLGQDYRELYGTPPVGEFIRAIR